MRPFGIIIMLFTIFLYQCNVQEKTASTSVVSSSFKQFDVPNQNQNIDAQKGGSFTHENTGSTIDIPANAFVDKDGNDVEGDVTISYREFHTIADIITAGIPMYHEQDGAEGYLVTAGMCEIRGHQNDAEVFIKENASIRVRLASYYTGDGDVEFYQLDEATGKWQLKNDPIPAEETEEAVSLNKQIAAITSAPDPVMPTPVKPDEPMIDFNIKNSLTGTNLDFALWKNAGPANEDNPLDHPAFQSKDYRLQNASVANSDLGLVRATFWVNTSSPDSSKVSATLAPVLVGKALNDAKEAYKKQVELRKQQLAQLSKLQQQRAAQVSAFRQLNITTFGFFNCDVFSRNEPKEITLTIADDAGNPIDSTLNLYLIRKNSKENGVLPVQYGGIKSKIKSFSEGTIDLVVIAGGTLVASVANLMKSAQITREHGLTIKIKSFSTIGQKDELEQIISQL